jgi:hypothetical protein
MTHPDLDDDHDKEAPLDPAMERLQARLKRLLGFSTLVMGLGFVAVFAAILYKLSEGGSAPDAASIAATILIDKDERVTSMTYVDGRMVLLLSDGDASRLLHVDPATGKVLGETTFVAR